MTITRLVRKGESSLRRITGVAVAVLSFLPVLVHGQFTVKTRVSGPANWSTSGTWIQVLTGNISLSSGSTTVTGSGTSFLSQLQPGDVLMMDASPGTVVGTIASVQTNVSATLTAPASASVGSAAFGRQAVPASNDHVQIGNTAIAGAIDLTLDIADTVGSLSFIADDVSHALTHYGNNNLYVSGAATMNQPTATATVNWNIYAGQATVLGLVSFAGTANNSSRICAINLISGDLNAFGGITFASTSADASRVISMTGAAAVNLKGALTVPAGTLNAGNSGVFRYMDNVNAQTVNIFPAGAYNRLYLNNTSAGGATLSAAITASRVTGDVKVLGGLFSNGGNAITLASGKSFEVSDGATFLLTGNTGMVTGTSITKTFGVTSTVEYGGSSQTVSNELYGNLTLSGSGNKNMPSSVMTIAGNLTTAGTASFAAGNTLNIAGNVTFGAGTSANGGSFTHTVGGNWTDNGANLSGNSSVTFNGTGIQTLGGTASSLAFNNVTVTNASGSVRLTRNTTMVGALNMSGATTLFIPDAGVVINGSSPAGSITGNGTVHVTRAGGSNDLSSQYRLNSYTTSALTVVYPSTSNQSVDGMSYGALILSGSGTKTAAAAVSVANTLSVASGVVFDMSAYALGGTLTTITGSGYLKTQNTSATPLPSGKAWPFTVEYNMSTGGQTLAAGSYTDLLNSNTSGTNTLSVSASVSNTLTLAASSALQMNGGATASVNNVTLQSGSLLTLSNALLQVSGTITNSGSVNGAAGSLELNGVSGQTIPAGLFVSNNLMNLTISNSAGVTLGGTLDINGVLKLASGNLSAGNHLTLLSSATKTALIDGSGSGDVTGNVTMQRYLPSGFGYRYISSPFQSATVAELGDDMNLASSFPHFYAYDEDLLSAGWENYTNSSNVLDPLRGYAVNFGSSASPMSLDITGAVNNGTVSLAALLNNNRPYTQGFHLVGNPYPSPIDWDAVGGWTRTNIDDAVYFFNPGTTDQYAGTYSSYINGISSDGVASNEIGSMQGFFIHVSNGGFPVSGSLSVHNTARLNNLAPVFHKTSGTAANPIFRLSAGHSESDSIRDHLVIYFDPRASYDFDGQLDALKILNTDTSLPGIFSYTGAGQKLSISAIPFTEGTDHVIPVGLHVYQHKPVFLKTKDLDMVPPGYRLFWVDAAQGSWQELQPEGSYSFSPEPGKYEGRFYLIIGKEPPAKLSAPGKITVFQRGSTLIANLDVVTGSEGDISIHNLQGQLLHRQHLSGYGQHLLTIPPAPGIYLVSFHGRNTIHHNKIFVH